MTAALRPFINTSHAQPYTNIPTLEPLTMPLLTHSAHQISYNAPSPRSIHLPDIINAYSTLPRWLGAYPPITVGQHCMAVATHASPENALWGFLHDADEAYTGDIPGPLIDACPQLAKIKNNLLYAVAIHFNLPFPPPDEIILLDRRSRLNEARYLSHPYIDHEVLPLPCYKPSVHLNPSAEDLYIFFKGLRR